MACGQWLLAGWLDVAGWQAGLVGFLVGGWVWWVGSWWVKSRCPL